MPPASTSGVSRMTSTRGRTRSRRLWGTGVLVDSYAASMRDDDRYREWAGRMERHTCSPGMAAASLRWAARYDVRELLGDVRAPTLVIHRTDDTGTPVEHGRYLAEHIPGATYVELPGEDHAFFLGDQQPVLDAYLVVPRHARRRRRAAEHDPPRRAQERVRIRLGQPHAVGTRGRGARRPGPDQRRDRRAAAHVPVHRRWPAAAGVRQARRHDAASN